MASFLGKVLRNRSQPSATRFITLLNKSQTQILSAPPPTIGSETPQNPIFLKPRREDSNTNASSLVYPTFSFEYFLNPIRISQSGFIFPSEDACVASRESPGIWADSVKKKRKKKMNKHKLKKLRKRLRRKT